MSFRFLLFSIGISCFMVCCSVAAVSSSIDDPFNGPWEASPVQTGYDSPGSYPETIYKAVYRFYKSTLHAALSSGCPSYPSCSEYMYQCIQRFSLFPGIILGMERLLHEPGETARGKLIATPEGIKVLDPIANNTFWWRKAK